MSTSNENFKDKFIGHLSNNRGKYSAAGTVGATLGGINLAGNGYLGTRAQDVVQDLAYPVAHDLKTASLYNDAKASITPYLNVYSKPDNILANDNTQLLTNEKVIQPGNIPAIGGDIGEKLVSGLTGLTPNEKFNYAVRHPIDAMGAAWDQSGAATRGAIDSVSDFIHRG